MAKLLYIESSPRKERSASIEAANAFLESYRTSHLHDQVETIDLWNFALPEFDGETINAKYAILHGQSHTPEQATAWGKVITVINQFKAADKYLFSLPMWNFGIPYKLKHYIDVLVQPGQTFSYSPTEGYKGLVTGKPAAVIYARGGAYGEGTGMEAFDLQRRYLDAILGFIGFKGIHSIVIEGMLGSKEEAGRARATAKEQAKQLAATF